MSIKDLCLILPAAAGGALSSLLGGWNAACTTLCLFMASDYVTGLIVAGVFHSSPHSESGTLESRAGLKGLCRKCVMLLFVLIAHRLDIALGVTFVKDGVTTAFLCNEALSIIENAGLMGLPMPDAVTRAIEVLKSKLQGKEE